MTVHRFARHAASVALALTAVACAPDRPVSPDAAVATAAASGAFPGFCAAIVDAKGIRFIRAAGQADRAAARPYDTNTVQAVGSVSKTVIGLALARAARDGIVQLDAPVQRLLPLALRWPEPPAAAMTLRHLATHTSGLRDREPAYAGAYVPVASADTGFADFLVSYLAPAGSRFDAAHRAPEAPGRRFAYSNIGAALAALALERATGSSFASLARTQVFEPLDMTRSSFGAPTLDGTEAVPYDTAGRPVPPYRLVTYPDGGLRTSCADLARYLSGVLAAVTDAPGARLPGDAVRAMLTPQFPPDAMPEDVPEREPNQGLFWQFRRSGGIGHSGSDPGVSAFVLLHPSRGTGRLFMTNITIEDPDAAPARRFRALWQALESHEATLAG